MGVPLSAATEERLGRLFPGKDRTEAERLLIEDCADRLPFLERAGPSELDRIRFAVLKLSAGRIARLTDAVMLAHTDWRDVLVAAGFGDSEDAHLGWHPDENPAE